MKVKDILAAKGNRVVTIENGTSVIDAMSIFSANRIGSLLIVDKNNTILGIIGARDVLMAVVNHLEKLKTMAVDEIMTTNLIVGTEDDSVDYILAIMTENRIRHVPIMKGKELKGLVSIGDVVKALLKEKAVENRYLKDYIADKYPG
ncbi:MAG: CBS domain-containing protein [Proteobacteria bacterium]|nr:CBS domain-containing protein [Pseudomonadota bacterium]